MFVFVAFHDTETQQVNIEKVNLLLKQKHQVSDGSGSLAKDPPPSRLLRI